MIAPEYTVLLNQAVDIQQFGLGSKLESAFLRCLLLRDAIKIAINYIPDYGPILLCGFGDGRVYHHLTTILTTRKVLVIDWKFSNSKLAPPLKDRIDPKSISRGDRIISPSLCLILKNSRVPIPLSDLIDEGGIIILEGKPMFSKWDLLADLRLGTVGWSVWERKITS